MTVKQFLKSVIFDRVFHRERLYVLNYHIICEASNLSSDIYGTHTSIDHFRESIRQVAERYSLVDIYDWISNPGSFRHQHCVAISFDDGHRSVLQHALPILKEFNVPATLFINTGYWTTSRRICWSEINDSGYVVIDGKKINVIEAVAVARNTNEKNVYQTFVEAIEEYAAQSEKFGQEYLTLSDLGAETSSLINIGMHGHLHHRHSMFDKAWQKENILANLAVLEALPNFVPLYAFPFGASKDLDADSIALCKSLDLIPVFHNRGYNVANSDGVRRIPADQRDALGLIKSQSPFLHKYDIH